MFCRWNMFGRNVGFDIDRVEMDDGFLCKEVDIYGQVLPSTHRLTRCPMLH